MEKSCSSMETSPMLSISSLWSPSNVCPSLSHFNHIRRYTMSIWLVYLGAVLQEEFNRRMSLVRVSVEWCFGKVLQYFAFIDYKKNLKVFHQPVGMLYI